ncbi:Cytochrome P450 monooxygenase FCK2 [Fusarium oxysporum f. sp. albedinis]|nr:Cytochrome P450 monooxygenase FCK2 [Fusarium oxysporum f. sp. albedinis]
MAGTWSFLRQWLVKVVKIECYAAGNPLPKSQSLSIPSLKSSWCCDLSLTVGQITPSNSNPSAASDLCRVLSRIQRSL